MTSNHCHVCYKRAGKRVTPCSFCGNADGIVDRKLPVNAPSVGLVPVTVLFDRATYETVKARAMALSAKGDESTGFSELVAATVRKSLAG